MKATLGDVRATVAKVLGMCATNSEVVDIINEVQQRLLPMGKWVGTYQHYQFCVVSGCVTLPRQLETLEVAAICNWPAKIRNEWHQYVGDGFGLTNGPCLSDIQDRGEGHVAFDDVIGTGKKLRVYSDRTEAAGTRILLQFWNQNGLPVYTEEPAASNNWINGEYVAISTTQTNTANFCMANGLVDVQKPITKGTVYLYEYDTVTTAQRLLAIYEPDETRPNYRRYVIPYSSGSSNGDTCSRKVVDVIAKRRFIPVVNDTDWLLIGNIGALKLGAMAIKKEEKNLLGEAVDYWGMARKVLDDELAQFLGDGARVTIQLNDEFANAAVENFV